MIYGTSGRIIRSTEAFMDILQLIDRLEELFNESKAIPLTRNVMVDEDRMLDIIDQMRIAIPEEVKKAQQLLGNATGVLDKRKKELIGSVKLAAKNTNNLWGNKTVRQQP